jgi:hypothetical protein
MVSSYGGYIVSKGSLLNGGSFKTVAQGGMSSNLPPATITVAELAAIFGSNGGYAAGTGIAPLHTMITFA